MPNQHEKVTQARIAQHIGVSTQTVSNAYNRPRKLSPALRERILATARELGYGGPDAAARSLRRGRAATIGLLLGEALPYAFEDPGAVRFLGGLADGCAAAGIGLLLVPAGGGSDDELRVRDAVVDGFVLWALAEDDPLVGIVLDRELPTVAIGSPLRDDTPFIGIDDRAAARAAAEHVIADGHRRIGIIAFPLTASRRDRPITAGDAAHATQRVSRERLVGYLEAISDAGLSVRGVLAHEVAVNTRQHGHEAARSLLTEPRPTAILAMSDELALGALSAAATVGLRVPHELAIVGWDDTRDATLAAPSLTTIHQDLRLQGRLAAQALLNPAEIADAPTMHLAPWHLVVRGST